MTLAAAPQTIASYYDSVGGKVHTGTRMKFGQNSGSPEYYNPSRIWINNMKGSNPLEITCLPGTQTADGFIDCSTSGSIGYICGSVAGEDGWNVGATYVLTWTGTGTVTWRAEVQGYATETLSIANRKEYTLDSTPSDNHWITHTGGTITELALFEKTEETAFNAGNVLHSQFVADQTGIDTLRCMDWMFSNGSWVADVADLTPYTELSWKGSTQFIRPYIYWGMPIKAICEACNELSANLWMCIPPHATDALVTEICDLIEATLDHSLAVYIEWGNEHWNSASAFQDFYQLSLLFDAVDKTATVVPATSICTNVGHGMTGGEEIKCFNNAQHQTWPYARGKNSWVDVIDADTFYLSTDSGDLPGSHRDISSSPEVTFLLYKEDADSSKTQSVNYAERSMAIWAIADAQITNNTVYHVAAGQAAAESRMTAMLAVTGFREAMDYYAIAPYYKFATTGTGDTTDDWETQTEAQMAASIAIDGDAWAVVEGRVNAHIEALGTYRIIAYEGGDHSGGQLSLSSELQEKLLAMHVSASMGTSYTSYYTQMSGLNIPLFCNYSDYATQVVDSGNWGLQEYKGDTALAKYTACKSFLDNGGVPKG